MWEKLRPEKTQPAEKSSGLFVVYVPARNHEQSKISLSDWPEAGAPNMTEWEKPSRVPCSLSISSCAGDIGTLEPIHVENNGTCWFSFGNSFIKVEYDKYFPVRMTIVDEPPGTN